MTAVPAGTASWSGSGTGAQAPARPAVPWLTVIPLAAMMAYADGFWMVSLRGAVGAIERTQEPFASWLRESTVLLPVFVVAVIAAVTLALRWFGPVLAGKKAFLTTALLIAAAGTLAGTATLAASEAWDYALQHDLMGTLHHASSVQSADQLDQASLGLQLAAFGYGAGLLLVTNLVVTGWTVAIRGGRLDVSRQQKATPERTPRRVRARRARTGATDRGATDLSATDLGATDLGQMLPAVALFGCAAIHLAVIPDHMDHWPVASAFFLALAMAEIACGVLLLGRARPSVLVAVAAAAVVPLALWVWSRTSGLPFGPTSNVPEPVGLADVAAGLLELGTLVIAVVLFRARHGGTVRPAKRTAASAHFRALAVVGAIAIGSLGVAGAVPGWLGELPSSGDITHVTPH